MERGLLHRRARPVVRWRVLHWWFKLPAAAFIVILWNLRHFVREPLPLWTAGVIVIHRIGVNTEALHSRRSWRRR